jgi:hypothetical protein
MAQAATHPIAAVLSSPANSLGSALSQFLSYRTKNHPENQKLRQSLSVNATAGFASSFFVSSRHQASVVLADGSHFVPFAAAAIRSFVPYLRSFGR